MKVLFTGKYQPAYNRNFILLTGLRNLKIEVIEFPFTKKNAATRRALKKYDQEVDFIYLPSFTHMDVAFVRRNTSRPLIFDPLISRYMSKVFDYQKVHRYSVRALKNFLKDYIMMKRADVVIADTRQHLLYYSRVIRVDPQKISIIPVGVNLQQFYPVSTTSAGRTFRVGFYGSYIPLHGIDIIVEAARLLEQHKDITFELVGNGITEKEILKLLRQQPVSNLLLTDWVAYEQLNAKINSFDLCLGIFGNSIKTETVVPNKVYHYAACRKCIITKDTPAIREVFTDRQNIILSDGSPEDLAGKILELRQQQPLRESIAQQAQQLMVREYNQDIIAQKLIEVYQKRFSA